MHNKLLLILFWVFTFSIASVQSQITEINGRKVEFKEDGTWEYIDDESQQDVFTDKNEAPEIISEPIIIPNKFDTRQSNQKQRREKRNSTGKATCSELVYVEVMSDFSGLQRQTEEIFVLGRNPFFVNWTLNKRSGLLFNVQFKTPRCISHGDKISFYFRDISENFTVSNIASPNCDGYLKIQDEKVSRILSSEKIISISIRTKEGVFTENLSDQISQSILEFTNCILQTANTK